MSKSSAGRIWEKKFENMRGRESIGFELSAAELENLVFPQAVEEKFEQLGLSGWDERRPMEAKLVGKVILFIILFPPIMVGTELRCRPDAYPSSPHPPLYPPQVAQTCVDWLIHKTGNIHADSVRMRTSSPPLPSPYPALFTPRSPYQLIRPLPPPSFPTVDHR